MLLVEGMLMATTKITKTSWPMYAWGVTPSVGDTVIANRSSPVVVCSTFCWTQTASNNAPRCNQPMTMARRNDGTLWATGVNSPDQMLPGFETAVCSWSVVGGGADNIFMIDTSGQLWAAGNAQRGTIGNNVFTDPGSPVLVSCGFTNWTRAWSAGRTAWGLRADGSFYGWGCGYQGAIGNGGTSNFGTPQLAATAAGAVCYFQGRGPSGANFVISTGGGMWAWGLNCCGVLGLGTTTTTLTPTRIGTSAWSVVATTRLTTVAIRQDGTMWSWGDWGCGAQGRTNYVSQCSPVQIGTLNSWVQVYNQGYGFIARRNDNVLFGWGQNYQGNLGLGIDNLCRVSPVALSGTWSRIWGSTYNNHMTARCSASPAAIFMWGSSYSIPGVTPGSANLSVPTLICSTGYTNAGPGSFSRYMQLNDSCIQRVYKKGAFAAGYGSCPVSPVVLGGFQFGTTNNCFVQITGSETWCCVSVGGGGVLGIKSNGQLWAWGRNNSNQLGLGTTGLVTTPSPIQVGTLTWRSVQAGQAGSVGISTAGNLYFWGAGGPAYTQDNFTARCSWIMVSSGGDTTMAIRSDNTLWGWGNQQGTGLLGLNNLCSYSSPVQIGTGTWKFISTNPNTAAAISQAGGLWMWGDNCAGQLGRNCAPFDPRYFSSPVQIGTSVWSTVAAGSGQTLAIRQDNTLWAWGDGRCGALGLGSTTARSSPVQVGTSLWTLVCTVSGFGSASSATIAIRQDGTLWAWGQACMGLLGQGSSTPDRSSPVQICSGLTFCWATVSTRAAAAITTGGTLYTWGCQSYGVLGLGYTNTGGPRLAPVTNFGGTTWKQITFANCSFSTHAVRPDGTLWVWGRYGALAGAASGCRSSPVQVTSLSGCCITDVTRGFTYRARGFAIQSQGTLWAWSNNFCGALGLNSTFSTTPSQRPTTVGGNAAGSAGPFQIGTCLWSAVVVLAPCLFSTSGIIALRQDRTLWAWGDNSFGRLGLGNTNGVSSPTQIGACSWASISGSRNHVMGILCTGALFTWGCNNGGALGQNSFVNFSSPVAVGAGTWRQISAGYNTSGAINTAGQLWVWGNNCCGVLGLGNTLGRSSPVQLGSSCWAAINMGAGGFFACNASQGLLDV